MGDNTGIYTQFFPHCGRQNNETQKMPARIKFPESFMLFFKAKGTL